MKPKSIPKTMKNQYKFRVRKRDIKNIEKHQKWSRKGSRKEEKTYQKEM
jgi:hypothetical protein